jgi:hypothetical protein
MVKFEVTSAKECTINGLGYFAAGETKKLDETDLILFKAMQGYPLTEANFPKWVEVNAATDGGEDK